MKLKDVDPNVQGSEYINANYIRQSIDETTGCSELPPDANGKVYIATQGKLDTLNFIQYTVLLRDLKK